MMTTTELTNNERALLAREVAADNAAQPAYGGYRTAFCAGWDAAMEYIAQKASESIAHIDGNDDDCCHFQD